MIDEFKNILLELNMKELTNGEKRTLQDILKYKIKSCVSDFYVCCGDCPFNRKYGGYGCIGNYINNKSNRRYELFELSEILEEHIKKNSGYWR